ncbi:MAG TPA: hypothetical protein VGF99_07390 [Myxococcota bacterium]
MKTILLATIAMAACPAPTTTGVDDDTVTWPTAPPPGGVCGRAWNTFDPRKIYVTGSRDIDDHTEALHCVVFGLGDAAAVARGYRCSEPEHQDFIRPHDGRILQGPRYGQSASTFTADIGLDDEPPCVGFSDATAFANDEWLTLPACTDGGFIDRDTKLLVSPTGAHLYSCGSGLWHATDGSTRTIGGHVLGINDADDALTVSNDERPPARFNIIRADDSRVDVVGLPELMFPQYTLRTTRVDGTDFIVLAAEAPDRLRRFIVDDDGVAHEDGTYAWDPEVIYENGRFDLDGAYYAPAFNAREAIYVVRLLPDGSPPDVVFRQTDLGADGIISVWSLLTGP